MKQNKFINKRFSTIFAIVLMITIAVPFLPNAFAQTFLPNARIAKAYAAESPNPAYINSNVYIVGWVYPPPSASGQLYFGYFFTVTKPNGSTFTRNLTSSTEATAGFNYVVDQAGDWKVTMYFPGDLVRNDRLPATSAVCTFTVLNATFKQPDYISLPDHPWSYPINSVNREWFRISGEWGKSSYGNGYSSANPYSAGPNTAHILWRLYNVQDSLIGGSAGHQPLGRQSSRYSSPVVAQNKMFFSYNGAADPASQAYAQQYASNSSFNDFTSQARHVRCLDMNTGAEIWDVILPFINYTTGQIVSAARTGGGTLQWVAVPTGKGAAAQDYGNAPPGAGDLGSYALWVSGGGLWKIDPSTGGIIWYQLTPTLSPIYFDGSWYIGNYPSTGLYSCIGAASDYGNGFPATTLIATPTTPGSLIWQANMSTSGIPATPNAIIGGYLVQIQTNSTTGGVKLNTWNAYTGQLVANGTWDANPDFASSGSNPCYGPTGYSRLDEDGTTRFYSYATGSLLWVSEPAVMPWGTFGNYQGSAGNGVVVAANYDGYKYCYNDTNGKLIWKLYSGVEQDGSPNPYNYEYASNAPPQWGIGIIATNNVYWCSGEHTPGTPQQRGDSLYCVEKDTGRLVFQLPYMKEGRFLDWSGVGCEKFWCINQYDGMVYVFGKGTTETTVTSSAIVEEGGATLIRGTVMDTSTLLNGTPAVVDSSMSTWMAYKVVVGSTGPLVDLANVTGVPVSLSALGSDGSKINIGTVTSDRAGFFTTMWNPPSKNVVYTIVASFGGSEAYYPSSAETSVGVTAAPSVAPIVTPTPSSTVAPTASPIVTPTVAPTPTPTTPAGPGGLPASTMYAIAAAVVVIVIVAVAAVALRRRK
jgi:hypothetical protein